MLRITPAFVVMVFAATSAFSQTLWADGFENLGGPGSPPGPYAVGPLGSWPVGPPGNPIDGGWDTWAHVPTVRGAIVVVPATPPFPSTKCLLAAGTGGFSGSDIVQDHSVSTGLAGNPAVYNHGAFGPGAWPGHTPLGPPGL